MTMKQKLILRTLLNHNQNNQIKYKINYLIK